MKKIILGSLLLACSLFTHLQATSKVFHYYCTVSDEDYFPFLINLIGSIHEVDFEKIDQIAVFDIGLSAKQKEMLENIEKTKVYEVEKIHPDLFTHFTTNVTGKAVRGWFAWKPVVFKQALEMFPYFLYLDAGTLVLNSPDNLFRHIKQNGYFLLSISPHAIENRITQPVLEKVVSKFSKCHQDNLLSKSTPMLDGGIQGISQKVLGNYVLPMYEMAADLTLFADDGSSKMGFGGGRHDQTLFSLLANANELDLSSQGWTNLKIDGQGVPCHIHWNGYEVRRETCIYRSRRDCHYDGDKTPFIHWISPQTR